MDRLTHKRENGIKQGYWSSNRKEELVQCLGEYEDTGLVPEQIKELKERYEINDFDGGFEKGKVNIFSSMFYFYIYSEFFHSPLDDFLDTIDERGACVKEKSMEGASLQEWEEHYFESKFAREFKERYREIGCCFQFQPTEEQLREYFSNINNDDVLFCVMCGHWLGLNKGRINHIKKAKTPKVAYRRLYKSLPIENTYYIDFHGEEIIAHKEENGATLVAENGVRYKNVIIREWFKA